MYDPLTGEVLTRGREVFRREIPRLDAVLYFPQQADAGAAVAFRDARSWRVETADQRRIPLIKYPFVHESYFHPKVGQLRDRLRLDERLAGCHGFERISRLYRQARYELQPDLEQWPLPDFWDLVGYDTLRHNTLGACGECSHRLVVLASACGYIARKVNIGRNDPVESLPHMCTEIWSDEHGKWVFWDAMIPCYYEDVATGEPLSASEVQDRYLCDAIPSLRICSWRKRHAKEMSEELLRIEYGERAGTTVEGRWGERFHWCVVHMGNNYLDMPANRVCYPVALIRNPGMDEGRWRQGGQPVGYYDQGTFIEVQDVHNLYPPQNRTEIHVADTPDGPLLALAYHMPNFARLEVRINEGDWKPTAPLSKLELQPRLAIEARCVNAAGLAGRPAVVRLAGC